MNTKSLLIAASLLLAACGSGPARAKQSAAQTQPQPKEYTYRVVATYPHATTSYTQGLFFADGVLWEGTGQEGRSSLLKCDLKSGSAEVVAKLPRAEFGEGIALLDGKIYQLTWQSNRAHVYDAATGKKLHDFRYAGEGWGITTDGAKLYMSDGSEYIYTLDPTTFSRQKRTTVTFKGEPVRFLNELEWIAGKIWANVYTTDTVVIIDPTTGVVEGVIDLRGILPEEDKTPGTDVLNGIAYDAATGRIFVTGKNWSKLFEIEILEK